MKDFAQEYVEQVAAAIQAVTVPQEMISSGQQQVKIDLNKEIDTKATIKAAQEFAALVFACEQLLKDGKNELDILALVAGLLSDARRKLNTQNINRPKEAVH